LDERSPPARRATSPQRSEPPTRATTARRRDSRGSRREYGSATARSRTSDAFVRAAGAHACKSLSTRNSSCVRPVHSKASVQSRTQTGVTRLVNGAVLGGHGGLPHRRKVWVNARSRASCVPIGARAQSRCPHGAAAVRILQSG